MEKRGRERSKVDLWLFMLRMVILFTIFLLSAVDCGSLDFGKREKGNAEKHILG